MSQLQIWISCIKQILVVNHTKSEHPLSQMAFRLWQHSSPCEYFPCSHISLESLSIRIKSSQLYIWIYPVHQTNLERSSELESPKILMSCLHSSYLVNLWKSLVCPALIHRRASWSPGFSAQWRQERVCWFKSDLILQEGVPNWPINTTNSNVCIGGNFGMFSNKVSFKVDPNCGFQNKFLIFWGISWKEPAGWMSKGF